MDDEFGAYSIFLPVFLRSPPSALGEMKFGAEPSTERIGLPTS